MKQTSGTTRYKSPEKVKMEPHNLKSDIWTLGVVALELLVGNHPFQTKPMADQEVKEAIIKGNFEFLQEVRVSPECLSFLQACLQTPVEKRLSCHQLALHPFLTSDNFDETVPLPQTLQEIEIVSM